LARRFKTPLGEIDIIARRGNLIAFIEVKARQNLELAAHSIGKQQQSHIARAAELFNTASFIFGTMPVAF
jgi:putative endonuclease